MQTQFDEAFAGLNTAQRAAVDTTEGPLLVVAGPGTGKTQLLSLRAANILRKTDADARNILCLTFTNYAAGNMRQRLAAVAGKEAYGVAIHTFHSFAAEIMNEYPDFFWNGARLSLAPDTVQLEIVQNILASLPLDNPLAMKFADNYTAVADVQQGLKLAKEAGLTPEKLAALIDVNLAYIDEIEGTLADVLSRPLSIKKLPELTEAINALPDQPLNETVLPLISLSRVIKEELRRAVALDQEAGKCTETSKWKRRWIQSVAGRKGMFEERRRNSWWMALAGVYTAYRNALHSRGYYDYADMLVEVIAQLEQQPELLTLVQQQSLHVMIDEFQDSNAAQLRLAQLVAANPGDEGNPNIMAVGDDDQTIFAFNGAELNNMLAFRRLYPEAKIIVLEENYRSHQQILDTADIIISQAHDRLVNRETDLTKHLKAQSDVADPVVEHRSFPTGMHQYEAIAAAAKEHWQSKPAETTAILARNHESLRRVSAILNEQNIPIRYEQQNNVLNLEISQVLLDIAEAVVAIGAGDKSVTNSRLSSLLRHPMWQIDPVHIWEIAVGTYGGGDWLQSLLDSDQDELQSIANWLLWLSGQAAYQPAAVLFEFLLGLRAGEPLTSPVRDYFLHNTKPDNGYLVSLSAANTLLAMTKEFAGKQEAKLADFVRFVRLNSDLGRTISDQSWFVSGDRAIELMTVHKAKGLEFDTVFLLDAVEGNWQPRHIGRKPPANLPLERYGEQQDDYVRLLYVAITRAKRAFIASSYQVDERGQPVLPTPLLQNIIPACPVETDVSRETGVRLMERGLSWPRLQAQTEKDLLSDRLDTYRLSATAFLQFLDITTGGPQTFLEKFLLGVPEEVLPIRSFGTAMHAAMQAAQRLTNEQNMSVEAVIESYSSALKNELLTVEEYERYLPHGTAVLCNLFEELQYKLPLGARAEFAMTADMPGGIRIGGKVDHMERSPVSFIITDYKTGKPLTNLMTRDQTKVIKAWRHRMQLTFYDYLARAAQVAPGDVAIENRIIYLEAEHQKDLQVSFQPTPEDLKLIERLIAAIWRRIQNVDMPDTSGYPQDIRGIEAFCQDLLSK